MGGAEKVAPLMLPSSPSLRSMDRPFLLRAPLPCRLPFFDRRVVGVLTKWLRSSARESRQASACDSHVMHLQANCQTDSHATRRSIARDARMMSSSRVAMRFVVVVAMVGEHRPDTAPRGGEAPAWPPRGWSIHTARRVFSLGRRSAAPRAARWA
jgi:hypothetical protein